MSGHTPGPWCIEADMRNERIGDMYADDGYREYLAGWNIYAPGEEIVGCEGIIPGGASEANARLIAAAPDLLASVIELLEPLERASAEMVAQGKALNEAGEAAFDRARAAIAKARGEA